MSMDRGWPWHHILEVSVAKTIILYKLDPGPITLIGVILRMACRHEQKICVDLSLIVTQDGKGLVRPVNYVLSGGLVQGYLTETVQAAA